MVDYAIKFPHGAPTLAALSSSLPQELPPYEWIDDKKIAEMEKENKATQQEQRSWKTIAMTAAVGTAACLFGALAVYYSRTSVIPERPNPVWTNLTNASFANTTLPQCYPWEAVCLPDPTKLSGVLFQNSTLNTTNPTVFENITPTVIATVLTPFNPVCNIPSISSAPHQQNNEVAVDAVDHTKDIPSNFATENLHVETHSQTHYVNNTPTWFPPLRLDNDVPSDNPLVPKGNTTEEETSTPPLHPEFVPGKNNPTVNSDFGNKENRGFWDRRDQRTGNSLFTKVV